MLGDDWPSPPTLQYLLLENPWPLIAVAAALAVGLYVVGGRQGRPRFQLASLGCLLAGTIVFALSYYVETEREQLQRYSRDVVEAFADPFDRELLASRISEDVTLFNQNVASLMPVAERAASRTPVTSYWVRRVLVEQDGPHHARTGIHVSGKARYADTEQVFSVQAIFHWRRQPGEDWELYAVPDVWVNQQPGDSVIRHLGGY